MQMCEVYLRNNAIYAVSQSFTELGVGVSVGPMFKVENKTAADVGNIVIAALDASRNDIPQPQRDDMQRIQKELFRFTGAKNWSDLVRTSACTGVERNGSAIMVMAQKTGSGGAFVPDGPGVPGSNEDVEGIGRAVLNALKVEPGA